MNNGIIGFTETQINLTGSTCKIIESLNFFSIILAVIYAAL